MAPENWENVRSNRPPYRSDVPIDDAETNKAKAERVQVGFRTVKEKLAESRPDVIIVFGDDQNELFDFNNHPSISVMVGESFSGRTPSGGMGGLGGALGRGIAGGLAGWAGQSSAKNRHDARHA